MLTQTTSAWFCMISRFFSGLAVFGLMIANMHSVAQSTLTLDSVSVNANNQVVLGWTLQSQAQEGYIVVYRQLASGLYAPVIQLPLSQSFYTDALANAQSRSWSYYLVARHPNGDNIAVSNQAHATIFLKDLQHFICNRQMVLHWQNYIITTSSGTPQPLPLPFDLTEVWLSFDQQEWSLAGSSQSEIAAYIGSASEAGQYCYRIRTRDTGSSLSSSSNTLCIDTHIPQEPLPPILRKLSLDTAGENLLLLLDTDPSAASASYVVLKQSEQNQAFLPLDTLVAYNNQVVFWENSSSAAQSMVRYMIHTLDSCGLHVHTTGPVETVFLQVNSNTTTENHLQWNTFEGWQEGIEQYVVLRGVEETSEFETIAWLPSSQNQYTDDLAWSWPDNPGTTILYRIVALGKSTPATSDTILSNIAALKRESTVFIPNAFRPDSPITENRVFVPLFASFSPVDFRLRIFNRWGEKVFESDDPQRGWDGTINGRNAPAGVYSYVISYAHPGEGSQRKTGPLMLVR